jgi:hypothetical protein
MNLYLTLTVTIVVAGKPFRDIEWMILFRRVSGGSTLAVKVLAGQTLGGSLNFYYYQAI